MVRRIPTKQQNALVARERDRGAVMRLGMLLLCGLTLAGGFVYAGVQHFTALRIGYQTENLRRELDQMAEDQRRYLLEREAAASPMRLERAARKLGLQPLQPALIDPLARAKREATEKIVPASTQPARSKGAPAPTRSKAPQTKNPNAANVH